MKTKRILAVLLALIMMLSFASCKSEDSGTEGEKDNVGNSSVEEIFGQSKEPEYDEKEGLFCVIESGKSTHYNYAGEVVISKQENNPCFVCYADNGLTVAYDNATYSYGYADRDGVFQIEPQYYEAWTFADCGIALVRTEEGYGYINSKGEPITEFKYTSAVGFNDSGYAIASYFYESWDESEPEVCYTHVVDTKGNVIVEITDNWGVMEVYKDYYVCVDDVAYSIYDYDGDLLATVQRYPDDVPGASCYLYCTDDGVYAKYYEESNETENDCAYYAHRLYKGIALLKTEKFNGKKFVEYKPGFEITRKRVSTTMTGWGYGITEKGETKIPFEYDCIQSYGSYFVAIKLTGYDAEYDQSIDIYDSDYNKTAENIPYAFINLHETSGLNDCSMPDGYFKVKEAYDETYDKLVVIDYTGKTIAEAEPSDGIILCTPKGTSHR